MGAKPGQPAFNAYRPFTGLKDSNMTKFTSKFHRHTANGSETSFISFFEPEFFRP